MTKIIVEEENYRDNKIDVDVDVDVVVGPAIERVSLSISSSVARLWIPARREGGREIDPR